MTKVQMVVRIINLEFDEGHKIGAYKHDKSSEKYCGRISGRAPNKRIAFQRIIEEFDNNDIVKITFEKVEEKRR